MSAFLWRVIYAVVGVIVFLLIMPLFCSVVGFPLQGEVWQLLRICVACIAVIYVLFGPAPPKPFSAP